MLDAIDDDKWMDVDDKKTKQQVGYKHTSKDGSASYSSSIFFLTPYQYRPIDSCIAWITIS